MINLPDTVGYCVPNEYGAIFRMLRERVPQVAGIILSSHCHDDLGMAVANSLAAVEAGVRQIECTINGIGERAGNAALEEVAAAMLVRGDKFPFVHGLVLEQLYPTSQLLSQIISFTPPPNKAVVGSNAFAHEAGIHQHGVLAHPLTYEIMTPASVGVPNNRMVLGKHSGRRALAHRLKELGLCAQCRRSGYGLSPLQRACGSQKSHLRPGPYRTAPAAPSPGPTTAGRKAVERRVRFHPADLRSLMLAPSRRR